MNHSRTMLAVCFLAGLLGALVSSLFAWLLSTWHVPELLGIQMVLQLKPAWLYSRLVWGGIWGLVYFLTVGPANARRHWVRKGLWISLLPTAYHLFVVFPYLADQGWFGIRLGQATPLLVFGANLVWGFATGIFCRLLWGSRR